MANTGFKGLDVRQTGNQLVFRGLLQDSSGALVTSGTTSLYIYELQSDGTLKSYDFNDNTFKTTALTTETASMTHRTGNNSGTNTGIWSYSLSTLSGFTAGSIYLARIKNTSASPNDQYREFQYGSAEGDLVVTANGTGVGEINSDVKFWSGAAVASPAVSGVPKVDVTDWLGSAPNALSSGRVDVVTNAIGSGVITSTAINTGAITSTAFASGAITNTALASGAISASTFAASAITNTVLATGAISSGTFASGAITNTVLASSAISASTFTAGAILDQTLSGHTTAGTIGGAISVTYPSNFATLAIDGSGRVQVQSGTGTGQILSSSGAVTVGTNNDKSGYSLSQTFPANFATLVIDGSGRIQVQSGTSAGQISLSSGQVTVATNNDKTNYVLTQNFPSNFAAMVLDVSGRVQVQSGTSTGQISLSSGQVTVGTVASGGIGTTALAAGAITSSAFAQAAADKIWDTVLSGHTTSGTTGAALNGAGGATDPWLTALPGSYSSGTAGYIVGHNLDATVSSRGTFSGGAVDSVTENVNINMTQNIPTANTAQTIGDAMNAARAQGFGKWVLSGTTLNLYAADNTTVVRTFTLDSSTAPTQRV